MTTKYFSHKLPPLILGLAFCLHILSAASICHADTTMPENKDAGVTAENKDAGVTAENKDAGITAENQDAGITAENQDAGITAENQDAGITAENQDAGITAESILQNMTLEQKAAQLFVLTPEQLTGVSPVTQAGDATRDALSSYPVGGLIYMESNLNSESQAKQMLSAIQSYSLELTSLPLFLCVDEEGGQVTRLSGRLGNVPYIPSMWSVGESGNPDEAGSVGSEIATYLVDYGFNVDFAPVADVVADPGSSSIGDRSFGPDPQITALMVSSFVTGMQETGVLATLKHFPGHGSVNSDTHEAASVSYKTLDELKEQDLPPFYSGIDAGVSFIMAAHVSFPTITGDDLPASLSHYFLTDLLREDMDYDGLIITDALNMGAIANYYSSADAAVKAFNAGADLLLMPADFHSGLQGIIDGVNNGAISEDRLNESVLRIIRTKLELM